MAIDPQYMNLPFDEAIAFFKAKIDIPTKHWDDLWQEMHNKGFMVAGAMKADLLADFHQTIEKAITEGMTLAQFRKDFDNIVEKHGWKYKGGRNWRTRIIFETNINTAYQAGRYAQMTDPETLKLRPYWEYGHGDSINPREDHLAWDGTVLPADHPWWDTHYTPNGWGCHCKVYALSERDLERLNKKVSKTPPRGKADDGWGYVPGKNKVKEKTYPPELQKYLK